jgi:predicted MFS family arabinose efflux permease
MEPVFVLYVLHGLGVAEELLGILLAFGAVGSIAGGLLTGRLEKRLGTAPLIALCAAACAAAVPVLMLGDRFAVLT